MRTLNLGILAHVDAGKTSLTERLLFAAGVIDQIGRVDDGSTQTDTLALERQRGITIKAAVVSFVLDDVTVNLIDTPGHPDFIAEVDRALSVLDGAVLVISAVEGVQAQTRVLMRALRRLRIPVLIFVNKIDRSGAAYDSVLRSISVRLTPAAAEGDPGAPPSGTVFKVDRGPAGEKVAYVRMFAGTVRVRDRLPIRREQLSTARNSTARSNTARDSTARSSTARNSTAQTVTAVSVFECGSAVRRDSVAAGQIGQLRGLSDVRIGDVIGVARSPEGGQFPPPTLEAVVVPARRADQGALYAALVQLAGIR